MPSTSATCLSFSSSTATRRTVNTVADIALIQPLKTRRNRRRARLPRVPIALDIDYPSPAVVRDKQVRSRNLNRQGRQGIVKRLASQGPACHGKSHDLPALRRDVFRRPEILRRLWIALALALRGLRKRECAGQSLLRRMRRAGKEPREASSCG